MAVFKPCLSLTGGALFFIDCLIIAVTANQFPHDTTVFRVWITCTAIVGVLLWCFCPRPRARARTGDKIRLCEFDLINFFKRLGCALGLRLFELNHLPDATLCVQIIRPCLHHGGTLCQ